MRHEVIVRAEAAVEMRDLAVKAVIECADGITCTSYEERTAIKMLVDMATGRIRGLRLSPEPRT